MRGIFQLAAVVSGALLVAFSGETVRAQSLTFDPPIDEGLHATVASGAATTASFTLTNAGGAELAFAFLHFAGGRTLGGPDAFGYSWIDSDQPHGPSFEGNDIRTTGIEVTPLLPSPGCGYSAPDEGYQVVDLPFAFPFYGEVQNQVWISANGFLTFDPQVFQVQCSFAIHDIPSTARPNYFIAPLWADLHGYTDGRIYVEHLTDGRFVVQWTDWARFQQQGLPNTFQAILSPNGEITYEYLEVAGTFGAATRVGVENQDGTVGLQVASGGDYVDAGLAVRITLAPVFVSAVTPASGTLAPGATVEATVTFDGSSLLDGVYTGSLHIETGGDPPTAYAYPVTLTVEGEAGCEVEPAVVDFPETIVGDVRLDSVQVVNHGTASCTLTSASIDDDQFGVAFGDPVTLEPDESATLGVSFAPAEPGNHVATLAFVTDGADVVAVLQGTAVAPPEPQVDPPSVAFSLPVGGTATQVVTLTNAAAEGAADLVFEVSLLLGGARAKRGGMAAPSAQIRPEDGLRGGVARRGPPVPQGAPPPFDAHGDELVQDGSFEAGTPNPYWSEGSLAYGSPICSHAINCNPNVGSGPLTGEWWVWLGGAPDFEAAFVSQTVAIPPGEAQLTFWLEMPVSPTSGVMRVMLDDEVIFQATGADVPGYPTYQEVVIDMGAHADGQERVLRFEAQLDAGSFFLDDVSLLAWVPIISADQRTGSLAPGGALDLLFTADTDEIEPGTYHFDALITTNAPQQPQLVVPIEVVVMPIGSENEASPASFAMYQNHPNPFSRTTVIEYSLAEPSAVRIDVYDVAGRRVTTLVDGELEAGRHTATWDASGVAAGMYFYRIQAGIFTRTMRAVVVR